MELISKRDDRSIFWQMILGLLFVAAAATGSYVLSHTLTHPAQYAQYTQAQN